MGRMPEDLRRELIALLYRRADELDWDGLSAAERSAWYTRWLDDPDIGGVLDAYMTRDQVRLWIKDTPMKHYNRARSGIGPYRNLANSRLPDAPKLTRLAFDDGWHVVEGSIRDKPNGCLITKGDERVEMIWGPPRAFQSLVWAALNAVVDGAQPPVIVVVTHQGERLAEGQVARHQKMGQVLNVVVRHVTANTEPASPPQSSAEADRL